MNSDDVIEARYPHVTQVFGGFIPYFEDGQLDPGIPLDDAILLAHEDGTLPAIEADLARMVQDSQDEATAMANLMPWLDQTGLPDGKSYRDWLLVVLARVRQGLHDPASIPDTGPDGGHGDTGSIPRVSWYEDVEAANRASTLVLREHEAQLRAWTADPGGWWRQHYYVPDLGIVTGYIITGKDQEFGEPVRGAVAIMKLDDVTGTPFILHAYPEITMPTIVRTELPDLCHLFGGYFNQYYNDTGGPLELQTNFQTVTEPPARARVQEQLDLLLHRGDDTLRADVEHLGAYLSPQGLRPWLLRMRWRMDAFDWTLRPND